MKKLFAFILTMFSLNSFAEDVSIGWKNGINPNATTNWQSIVYVSTTPNPSSTNFVYSASVQWPKTNATVINIPSGTKTYSVVYHYDLEDLSPPSTPIVYYKTKMNPPQQAAKLP